MCCCGKPVVNGELGYRWQPEHAPTVCRVNAPDVSVDDTIMHDEPGRCGGTDSHSHHYRVVKAQYGGYFLLVRHGGGDERIRLGYSPTIINPLKEMDSNDKYWQLNALYHTLKDYGREMRDSEKGRWAHAAAQGRIKTRKSRGTSTVKVTIEPENGSKLCYSLV